MPADRCLMSNLSGALLVMHKRAQRLTAGGCAGHALALGGGVADSSNSLRQPALLTSALQASHNSRVIYGRMSHCLVG
jgi:hypothetical protein